MAVQNGCAFYDYFHISGGQFALAQWRKMGLAQPDRVHLTYKGYALKAELMTNALLNSYREYVQNSPTELVANQFFADTTEFEETIPDTLITEIPASKPKSIVSNTARLTNVSYHTVKKGETISVIALRYQISNNDIKLWNNLKTNRLFAGQKLRVAPPMAVSKSIKTADKNASSKKKTNPPVFHLVKKGETLFSIAKKYKVSIQQLKQLNNLKKDTIQPGMRIKIK
jgi:LysM repeat protein